MGRWSNRIPLYQFSAICSYIMFAGFAVAFGIPIWLGNSGTILGLWAYGKGDEDEIDSLEGTNFGDGNIDGDWFDAVRGLWTAGMAFYLIGVFLNVRENWVVPADSKDYGVSGMFIVLAGMCGCAGVVTLAVEVEEDDIGLDYMWGFILAVVSSGLAIILAIVMLVTKNYERTEMVKTSRTADYVYAHKQPPYAPEYNNAGYRGDELPLVNGLPYQHQGPYSHSPYNMYRTGMDNGHPGPKFDHGAGYNPYGYKDTRVGNRTSMAESADLSNGFTQDIVHAEHSLGRRGDVGRSQYARGDYFYNGSRPY